MKLKSRKFVRLFAVAEKEESGKYALKEFGANSKEFNTVIDSRVIDGGIMMGLAITLLGKKEDWAGYDHFCFEVTDKMAPDKDGKLCFDLENNDRLVVRNIVNKIDAAPKKSRYFVLINSQRTAYCWVVAVPVGTIYSD